MNIGINSIHDDGWSPSDCGREVALLHLLLDKYPYECMSLLQSQPAMQIFGKDDLVMKYPQRWICHLTTKPFILFCVYNQTSLLVSYKYI